MNRNELLRINEVINEVLTSCDIVKLNYYLYHAQDLIEAEQKLIQKAIEPDERYLEYQRKRLELCNAHCDKDVNGDSVVANGVFQGLGDSVEFRDALMPLTEEYREDIEKYMKQEVQANELLEEDVEIEFKKIPTDLIPDGLIKGDRLKVLRPLMEPLTI